MTPVERFSLPESGPVLSYLFYSYPGADCIQSVRSLADFCLRGLSGSSHALRDGREIFLFLPRSQTRLRHRAAERIVMGIRYK